MAMTGRAAWVWLVLAAMATACGGNDALSEGPKLTNGDAAGADTPGLDGSSEDVATTELAPGDDAAADGATEDAEPAGTDALVSDAIDAGDAVADGDADVGPACPGNLGCSCATDAECPAFAACLDGPQGKACFGPCQSGVACPDGSTCVPLPGAATDGSGDKTVCAPKFPTLCDPCQGSSSCVSPGSPQAACVSAEANPGLSGWFCGTPCKADSDCPGGSSCGTATLHESGQGQFCLPKSGTCDCSSSAKTKELKTTCASSSLLADGTLVTGCVGERGCGPTGLTACSAPIPATETCNGLDDDCNGATDDASNLCDDGNACTADACKGGLCAQDPEDKACDDGSACTTGDACKSGACGGQAVPCDDGNACTKDSCNPASGCVFQPADGLPCEDGQPCTTGDICSAGQCQPGASGCECASDADCGKGTNLCKGSLYCDKSKPGKSFCALDPTTVVVCDPKVNTVCAANQCDPGDGKCKLVPQGGGKACDDGSACTSNDVCGLGICTGATVPCDDGNACTDDACDAKQGCLHSANLGACDDGSACTSGDHCSGAVCTTSAVDCDDGYLCTMDSCDPNVGCAHTLVAAAACGVVAVPYVEPFTCGGAGLGNWQLGDATAPAGTVRWSFDATPAVPGFQSPGCSLNVNNGKDLKCAPGQAAILATADSPWLDLGSKPGSVNLLRFSSAGSWTGLSAKVQFSTFGGAWTDLATIDPSGATWQPHSVSLNPSAAKIRIRFVLSGPCGANVDPGWFVDDLVYGPDVCATANGGCPADQLCTQGVDGKAICSACAAGFSAQGGTCVDVDECKAAGSCDANATCSNTPGSFTCACKAGWKGDGKTCVDVDECAAKTDGCAPTAACVNTPGSVLCVCPKSQYGDGKTCVNKGGAQAFPAGSCLDILTTYPGSVDGVYWLDIDGAGASPSAQYLCDMKGGGWTLLIWDDFEDGSTKGWSAGPVTTCGKFGKILGGSGVFGKGAATQKAVLAPVHTQARFTLQYARIDGWLFEQGFVQIEGKTVWSKKGTGDLFFNGDKECGKGAILDEEWDASWQGGHTAATVTIRATSDLNNSADNESFGIDNVILWVK